MRKTNGKPDQKELIKNLLPSKSKLKCKNAAQKKFYNLIKEKEITIASGPAGTGKSHVSLGAAIELLKDANSPYTKIKIAVPVVEVDGENIGYLPGDVNEKMEPYVASSLEIVDDIIGSHSRISLEHEKILVIEPISFIRGKSINNTIFIMEESQNLSPNQMKTLLSRIGYNSKFIVSGDLDQSDRYKDVKDSGLYDAMLRHNNIEEIGFFRFNESDIVRNPLITKILLNYKIPESEENID